MTRTTKIAALLAAGLGLSACMADDSAMSNQSDPSQLTGGVSNPDEDATMSDTVNTPTDGIEDNPDT